MLRAAATAILIAATTAGCSGDIFEGMLRPWTSDQSAEKPEAARVKSLLRVADASAAAGDMSTAMALYRRAHKADPSNPTVLQRLGDALLTIGEYDQAISVFKSAINISDKTDPYIGIAKAFIAVERPQAAIEQLNAALKIQESIRLYNVMGVAYDMQGDHGAAQAYYRTGLDIDRSHTGLLNNLGLSLSVSGRHDEAIQVLRKSASGPKATPRNRLNLALAYGMAGEVSAAAEMARIDLDEAAVQRNLAFYATLRALNDSRMTIRAIGAHNAAPLRPTGRS